MRPVRPLGAPLVANVDDNNEANNLMFVDEELIERRADARDENSRHH